MLTAARGIFSSLLIFSKMHFLKNFYFKYEAPLRRNDNCVPPRHIFRNKFITIFFKIKFEKFGGIINISD